MNKYPFKIDGVEMPTPSQFQITLADADGKGAGRNAKAYTRRKRLRAGIRGIQVKYLFLTQAQAKQILDAVEPVFVEVTYFDPQHGQVTKTMNVGDRVLPFYGKDHKGNWRWQDLSFTLSEK